MKWFDRWFLKKYRRARQECDECEPEQPRPNKYANATLGRNSVSKGVDLQSRGMTFTIYPANGGHILEYSNYDEKTDRHNNGLHIITSEQDMGQAISHAYTLESLKR
jgi:hypothetical protein